MRILVVASLARRRRGGLARGCLYWRNLVCNGATGGIAEENDDDVPVLGLSPASAGKGRTSAERLRTCSVTVRFNDEALLLQLDGHAQESHSVDR